MIPNKINILGIPFKVNEYPDFFQSDSIHFGEINYQAGEIKLSQTVPDELKLQTLIHEWVHGVLFMLGREDIKSDEQLVQGLSIAIYQTFCILEDHIEMEQETE